MLTDYAPVYHALSVHRSRAKLVARSAIDMPWRNFRSVEFRKKVQERCTLIFVDTRNSLNRSVGLVERSLRAKKQINPFIPFDRTPTCDRRTRTYTRKGRPQQHRGACCFLLRFSRVIFNSKQQQRLLFLAAKGWIKSACTCKHVKEIRTNTSAPEKFGLDNAPNVLFQSPAERKALSVWHV